MPPESLAQNIARILSEARGRDAAIRSREIATRLGLPATGERQVREIIATYQDRWPFLVCGAPGGGYFIPDNFDEVYAYHILLLALETRARTKRQAFEINCEKRGFPIPEKSVKSFRTVRKLLTPQST